MIIQPIVDEIGQKHIKEVLDMPGWKYFHEPILDAANDRATGLIEYEFERDENNGITQRSINDYEKMQIELRMLKSFLNFVRNGGIIIADEDNEVFEV